MADISKIKLPDNITYNIKDSTKLPLVGGTMSGQIKTSFNSSVATGSYGASAHTIPDLCEELRYSSGVMGSFDLTTSYTKDGVTIPTRWYNFLWIPHRSGGINGQASGDNCDYGSLLLSAMTGNGLGVYALHYFNGNINTLEDLTKDTNTTYTLSTSGNNVVLTPSSGSANTITVPYATSADSATTASKLGSSHVGGGDQPIYLTNGTPTACNYRISEVRQYVNDPPSNSKYYPILTSYNDTTISRDTEVTYVNKQLDLLYDPKLKILSCGQIVTDDVNCNSISANSVTCNSMSVTDISDQYTFSKTSGNWSIQSFEVWRMGNFIQMRITFKGNGSNVASGSNGFVGAITGGAIPVCESKLTGYYGGMAVITNISKEGAITARVCGGTSTTISASGAMGVAGTFICV